MTDTRVLYKPTKDLWETLPGDLGATHNLNLSGFVEGVIIEGEQGILARALPRELSKVERFEPGEIQKAKLWVESEVRWFYTNMLALLLSGVCGDSL